MATTMSASLPMILPSLTPVTGMEPLIAMVRIAVLDRLELGRRRREGARPKQGPGERAGAQPGGAAEKAPARHLRPEMRSDMAVSRRPVACQPTRTRGRFAIY